MKGLSIRARLTLWIVGALAVMLVALGLTLRCIAEAVVMASVDDELSNRAVLVMQRWTPFLDSALTPPSPAMSAPAQQTAARPESESGDHSAARKTMVGGAGSRYPMRHLNPFMPRLFDLSGHPMLPVAQMAPWDARTLAVSIRGGEEYSTVHVDDQAFRIHSVPLRRRGEAVGVLQIAEPLGDIEVGLAGLSQALLIMAPIAVILAGFGGAALAERALRPVRRIAQTADRIGAGNLSERLPMRGNDELTQLAETINGMLDRLEQAFGRLEDSCEQQRRFTADVSHELRTPLTVIRAHTSLALSRDHSVEEYRMALRAADRAAGQMNRIIQDLLLLARSDSGQLDLRLRPIPILNVLETAAETFVGLSHASIDVHSVDPSLCVSGDHDHLVRLFTNLVENAARYTPLAGRIDLRVIGTDTRVIVTVEDTGAGIAPEHVPHLCERFYRVDKARSRNEGGAGLGLSICRSIVDAHHGSLAIESAVGIGTTVRVTLPRAARRRGRSARPLVRMVESETGSNPIRLPSPRV